MTEQPESPAAQGSVDGDSHQEPTAEQQTAGWVPQPPPQQSSVQESVASAVADRPELLVGAAFAGGLLLAMILKRLAR
jgi:hypothetical protein